VTYRSTQSKNPANQTRTTPGVKKPGRQENLVGGKGGQEGGSARNRFVLRRRRTGKTPAGGMSDGGENLRGPCVKPSPVAPAHSRQHRQPIVQKGHRVNTPPQNFKKTGKRKVRNLLSYLCILPKINVQPRKIAPIPAHPQIAINGGFRAQGWQTMEKVEKKG